MPIEHTRRRIGGGISRMRVPRIVWVMILRFAASSGGVLGCGERLCFRCSFLDMGEFSREGCGCVIPLIRVRLRVFDGLKFEKLRWIWKGTVYEGELVTL